MIAMTDSRIMISSEKMPQDHDTPVSPPTDVGDALGGNHQLLHSQTNLDQQEVYNEGEARAALDQPASNIDPLNASIGDYEQPSRDEQG